MVHFVDAVALAQGIVAATFLALARATIVDAIGIVFACPVLFVGVVRVMRGLYFALTGRQSRLTTIGRSRLPPVRLGRSVVDHLS